MTALTDASRATEGSGTATLGARARVTGALLLGALLGGWGLGLGWVVLARDPFDLGRARTSRRAVRAASVTLAARLGVDVPVLVTAAFALETILGLPGLGEPVVSAARSMELVPLMAVIASGTLAVALAQLAGDLLVAALEPRARPGVAEGVPH
jgi:hypothetical protein